MTCLLSPWQLLSLSSGCSPMNPAFPSSLADIGRYAYPASDAESAPGVSGKKRASRAGTRSVSTLSAAQLDRKRANDREAQRAIRQRTKDHIESLEKTISDLRLAQEASDKLLADVQRRNRDLDEENAFLRAKLSEAGVVWPVEPPRAQDRPDLAKPAARSTSPAAHTAVPRAAPSAEPAPHAPTALSLVTPRVAGSHHAGFWQPSPQGGGMMQIRSAPGNLHDPTSAPMQSHLNWRAHDGSASQSMHPSHPIPGSPHEPAPPPPTHQPSPTAAMVNQYSPWPASPAQHGFHGHVLVPKREPTPQDHQQPPNFPPPPPTSAMYPPAQPSAPVPAQAAYANPSMPSSPPPPPSYQGVGVHVHVNSPVVYQVHQQQPQAQQQQAVGQAQYQMASAQPSPGMMGGAYPPQPIQGDPQSAVPPPYDPSQPYGQPPPHPQAYPTDQMGPTHQAPHFQNG